MCVFDASLFVDGLLLVSCVFLRCVMCVVRCVLCVVYCLLFVVF